MTGQTGERGVLLPQDDKPREECGVFGMYVANGDRYMPSFEAYTALFALQHRGQESCGIAANDAGEIRVHKNVGLVPDNFDENTLRTLPGTIAIGHVRYSTTGAATRENAQPVTMRHISGNIAAAHNGNLINAEDIRREIELSGGVFHTQTDAEAIAYLFVHERLKSTSAFDAVKCVMNRLRGAYSVVMTTKDMLVAFRDPNGFRPLCIGKLGNSYIFSSETCALDAVGADFIRDVHPGEIVMVENGRLHSADSGLLAKQALCIFEYVYIARPDSVIDGQSVELARRRMGAELAIYHPVDADIVIGLPDSGLSAAMGYAVESGIPYGTGVIKNRYIGRTFIQPSQMQREKSVRIKLNPLSANVKGKRVVIVDDSLVRGTTTARIPNMIREAGAKEVHMRIASPPVLHPCYFGTDIRSRDNLMAHNKSVEQIMRIIGVDSLGYLPVEALPKVLPDCALGYCDACFTGRYPDDLRPSKGENEVASQFSPKDVI